MAHGLIYCEDRADYDDLIARIKAEWPNAVIEDGSDDIHEYRFAATIENVEQDDLYRFALRNKFALSCLSFQLDMRMNTEHITQLVDEVVPKTKTNWS